MPQKDVREDAAVPDAPKPVARAQTRAFPSKADRARRSREHARAILLEAGYDPTIIEHEVERFLEQPLLFDLPSFDELRTVHASK
jgi:hypothetical protein